MSHIPTVSANANESLWMCLITEYEPIAAPRDEKPISVVSIILGVGLTLIVVILIVVFVRVCIVRRAKRSMYAACEYIILSNLSSARELKWNTAWSCIWIAIKKMCVVRAHCQQINPSDNSDHPMKNVYSTLFATRGQTSCMLTKCLC